MPIVWTRVPIWCPPILLDFLEHLKVGVGRVPFGVGVLRGSLFAPVPHLTVRDQALRAPLAGVFRKEFFRTIPTTVIKSIC